MLCFLKVGDFNHQLHMFHDICHFCNAVMWAVQNGTTVLFTMKVLLQLMSVIEIYSMFSCLQDSAGYPQKAVTLVYPAGNQMGMAEFQVRKMVNARSVLATGPESEEFQMLSSSSKRTPVRDENIVVAKRRRISSDTVECSEVVTKEIRDVGVDEPQTQRPLNSPAWVNKYQLLDQEKDGQETGEILEGEVKDVVVDKRDCCSHSQELESMKSELAKVRKESKARADEIKSLQKLVAALSRREGLA